MHVNVEVSRNQASPSQTSREDVVIKLGKRKLDSQLMGGRADPSTVTQRVLGAIPAGIADSIVGPARGHNSSSEDFSEDAFHQEGDVVPVEDSSRHFEV